MTGAARGTGPGEPGPGEPGAGVDGGSGSVLLLAVVTVAAALALAVAVLGAAVVTRHRAQAAADLAALAGADVVSARASGSACERARLVLEAHGAGGRCLLAGDGSVHVTARVATRGPLAALLPGAPAVASARAGEDPAGAAGGAGRGGAGTP